MIIYRFNLFGLHVTQKLNLSIVLFITLSFLIVLSPCNLRAQTETEITFVEELKEESREQLRRILHNYDLDDWIFTREIKIVHGEDARSYPILQLNTNHLDDDKVQLSVFVHENAHIFIADDKNDKAENKVIRELRSLYPNPPAPNQRNLYHHIMVVWIEYDALIELFGEDEAISIMERKFDYYTKDDPNSLLSKNYLWYNRIAMDNSGTVGKLMDAYGFNINPDKGIVLQ
jgi:hypothetical protein